MHVHKTGGSALAGALGNRFAADECLELYFGGEPDLNDLDRFRYVTGHLDASFIERFANPPFVLTALRDPIDRGLSSYSYTRSFSLDSPLPAVTRVGRGPEAAKMGQEWLRLTHECELDELISRSPVIAREYLGNRQARVLSQSPAGDERLTEALAGLDRCDFVALTDRLDESLDWLTRRLGWRELRPLPRSNVTGPRLRRDQIPSEVIESMARLTEVDRELFRRGVQRYERELEEWSALRDPRDPSARIPDAPRVSDLGFDQAILGGGWMNREWNNGGSAFCWIGDTHAAWVDMAADRRAGSVVIEIHHAVDEEILAGLHVSIDGKRLEHTLAEADGVVVATAPLRRRRPLKRRHLVEIEVERSRHPREVNPESTDNRELAIAVGRVALRPL